MRRSRIQIKPNLTKAGRTVEASPAPPTSNNANSNHNDVHQLREVPKVEQIEKSVCPHSLLDVVPEPRFSEPPGNSAYSVKFVVPKEADEDGFDPLAPRRRIAHAPVRRHVSVCEDGELWNLKKPEKKKFTGQEILDTGTMRMMDLIHWNPKKEKGLDRRRTDSMTSVKPDSMSPTKVNIAPQVKIDVDGRLVVDESSLFIEANAISGTLWETVEEGRNSSNVTSMSFRNRLWRKGTTWSQKETDLFYEILRCTGTDFGLMHDFFPSRARNELKNKFNREEKFNMERINAVMSQPASLDDSLHERVECMAKEIEKEKTEKALRARQKKEKNLLDWDENSADLEAEAEQLILELEADAKRQEKLAKKRQRYLMARSRELDDGSDSDIDTVAAIRRRIRYQVLQHPLEPKRNEPRATNKRPVYSAYEEVEEEEEQPKVTREEMIANEYTKTAALAKEVGGQLFGASSGDSNTDRVLQATVDVEASGRDDPTP